LHLTITSRKPRITPHSRITVQKEIAALLKLLLLQSLHPLLSICHILPGTTLKASSQQVTLSTWVREPVDRLGLAAAGAVCVARLTGLRRRRTRGRRRALLGTRPGPLEGALLRLSTFLDTPGTSPRRSRPYRWKAFNRRLSSANNAGLFGLGPIAALVPLWFLKSHVSCLVIKEGFGIRLT
jgi:hypothetical protein